MFRLLLQGYPGNLEVSVTYILQKPSTLKMIIEASTDKTTPINIAQHSYFNLAGHDHGDVLNHKLHINGYVTLMLDHALHAVHACCVCLIPQMPAHC